MFWKKFPHYRQLDIMDCGPTCVRIVARYHGKYVSIQNLRDKTGVTREGVSILDISNSAESIGFRTHATIVPFAALLLKVPFPCIVHWEQKHFVVVYKTDKRYVYVSDPATNLQRVSHQEFLQKWAGANRNQGVVMALEPQTDFLDFRADEPRKSYHTLQNFFGYLRPYRVSLIQLAVVMLLITALQATLPFITRAIYDVGIQSQDLDFIYILLLTNIVLILAITISNVLKNWILAHLTARINIALVSDYLIKLLKMPVTYFETKMVGDILQRANDHERIRTFIMNASLNTLFASLTLLIFGIILFLFNAVLFYIFLTGSLLYILWIIVFYRFQEKLDWRYYELTSKNQSFWIETIHNIIDIKTANYEKQRRWKWETIQAGLFRVNLNMLTLSQTQEVGSQFINNLKNIALTFFCAKSVLDGTITMGEMISTQFIIGMLNGPIGQFVTFFQSAESAAISFKRLNDIYQIPEEENQNSANNLELPVSRTLVLRNVSFQYIPRAELVLKNLNFSIPEGKITAIVGPSGSGKTTLLKLLMRLYQPSYGQIELGNMALRNLSLRQWRKLCGSVFQEGKLFNDTILNNIVLNDEQTDYDRLRKAVQTANIADEIETLPLGYHTRVGETGRGLSQGQKQRILLARAIYQNPDYLFLDEATNALDTINEQKIMERLDEFFRARTVVVAAHRLSTIRKADQIIVMKEGAIAEKGTHEELLRNKGTYYLLIKAQLSDQEVQEAEKTRKEDTDFMHILKDLGQK